MVGNYLEVAWNVALLNSSDAFLSSHSFMYVEMGIGLNMRFSGLIRVFSHVDQNRGSCRVTSRIKCDERNNFVKRNECKNMKKGTRIVIATLHKIRTEKCLKISA
jgi:hypothetical protein